MLVADRALRPATPVLESAAVIACSSAGSSPTTRRTSPATRAPLGAGAPAPHRSVCVRVLTLTRVHRERGNHS